MADTVYEGFPYISQFPGFVIDEFESRESGIKDAGWQATRYDFLDRTPFINMIPGVYKKTKDNKKIRYILTSNEITQNIREYPLNKNEVNSLFPSVFDLTDNSINRFYDSKTFRPHAGITNISVSYKNKFGSVRQATINWTCNSLEELEKFSPFFLTSGNSIYLEWGWSNIESEFTQIDIPNPHLMKIGNASKYIYDKLISKSNGNYDAMCGIITNYDYKITNNFTYECVTDIVSQGFIMESLKNDSLSINVSNNNDTGMSEQKKELPPFILNFRSYLESGKFYSEIDKYYPLIGTENADIDWMIAVDNENRIKQYTETIAYKESHRTTYEETGYGFSPEKYPMYISWGFIEDVIIGNNFNIVGNAKTEKIELSSLNSTDQKVSFRECLRSTDIYKCIIPVKNIGKIDVSQLKSDIDVENLKKIKEIETNINNIQKEIDGLETRMLMDIMDKHFPLVENKIATLKGFNNTKYDTFANAGMVIGNMRIKITKNTSDAGRLDILANSVLFDTKFLSHTYINEYNNDGNIEYTCPTYFNIFIRDKQYPIYNSGNNGTLSGKSTVYKYLVKKLNKPVINDDDNNCIVRFKLDTTDIEKNYTKIFSELYEIVTYLGDDINNKRSNINNMNVETDLEIDFILSYDDAQQYKLKINRQFVLKYLNSFKKVIGNYATIKAGDKVTKVGYSLMNPNIQYTIYTELFQSEKYEQFDKNGSIKIYMYKLDKDNVILKREYVEYSLAQGNEAYTDKATMAKHMTIYEFAFSQLDNRWLNVYDLIKGIPIAIKQTDSNKDLYSRLEKAKSERDAIEETVITEEDLTTVPSGYEKMSKFEFDGLVRRIMVNTEYLRNTLLEKDYLIDGVNAVMQGISNACGGYFDFILSHNDLRSYKDNVSYKFRKSIENSWYVCDMSSVIVGKLADEKLKEYVFSAFAKTVDGTIKNPFIGNFSFTTDVSKEASLNAFYSVQTGNSDNIIHGAKLGDSFYSLYKLQQGENFIDEFVGGKLGTDANVKMATIDSIMRQSRLDILKLHKEKLMTQYLYLYLPLIGSGYDFFITPYNDDTSVNNAKLVNYVIKLEGVEGMSMGLYGRFGNGFDRHSLLPMKSSIEMQGISGIRISDVFNIDYIPDLYLKYGLFHVVGISQTVDKKNWSTKIDGLYRSLAYFSKTGQQYMLASNTSKDSETKNEQ